MNTAVHFSSEKSDWATPCTFFYQQSEKYGPFDLDVCASPENAKCAKYYTLEDNGLVKPWFGKCWMNPPYGREIGERVAKAWNEVARERAQKVVCLLPARTDTRWWHDYVIAHAFKIDFIRGRIRFVGAPASAPFPSAVVVFR